MRLKYCYVESFGVIRKRRIDLSGDVVSVCEENGYGKTTLAVFLKAMFYGMDSDRANVKGLCERRHYLPFEGGRYGGYVVFEQGGSECRIERYFDDRSESRDSVAMSRGGRPVPGLDAQRIGEEIFGIDKASFERTMFINDDDVDIASTSSINAKLSSFVEGGGCDVDAALAALDRKAKEYRKSRPGNDLISNTTSEMYSVSQKIEDAKRVCEALPGLYAEYDSLTEERKQLEGDLERTHADELELKDWDALDAILRAADDAGAEADRIRGGFPSGIPTEEEIGRIETALACETALSPGPGSRSGGDDVARLSELDALFADGVPDDEALSETDSLIAERAALETRLSAAENVPVTERYAALSRSFSGNVPDEKTLSRLDEAAEACERQERGRACMPDYAYAAPGGGKGVSRKAYVSVAVAAAVVMASGIAAVFFNLIAGIVLLFAGIIILAVDAFVYLSKRQSALYGARGSDPETDTSKGDYYGARKTVCDILMRYGYTVDGSVRYSVETFEGDLKDYLAFSGERNRMRGETDAMHTRLSRIDESLDGFFGGFGLRDGDYRDRMSRLRALVAERNGLAEAERRCGVGDRARAQTLSENSRDISSFCRRYGISPARLRDDFPALKSDVRAYGDAVTRRDAFRDRAEAFRKEKNLYTRPATSAVSGTDTQGMINDMNARLDSLSRDIDDCESMTETLDGLNADLRRLSDRLDEYNENYKILTGAASLLSEADRNLRDRSFIPIRDGFARYADMLERAIGEEMIMKPDFELVFESGGSERSDRHLSSGQRSICVLCFRIALIENMYRDDRPFVILDDPFVHLDAKHFAKVKTLLKTLSKDVQIIYFTCHQSRAI